MHNTLLYPGSFDPPTLGHVDIIERAASLCDHLVVAVLKNADKKRAMFTLDERLEMLRACFAGRDDISFEVFDGLLVEFFRKTGARAVVRGIRGEADLEYEMRMASVNRKLDASVETLLLPANEAYEFVTSTVVREIIAYGGDISAFVPPSVQRMVKQRFGARENGSAPIN